MYGKPAGARGALCGNVEGPSPVFWIIGNKGSLLQRLSPMRSVILFIATSLDGFIARPDGRIDWLFTDQDYGYTAFYSGVETIVMGRKTYEQARSFGDYPYPGKETYVFSRSREGQRDEHAAFIAEDAFRFIGRMKARPGRTIWLVGGADLIKDFVTQDLIDEYVISVHPLILGAGIPLFPAPLPPQRLIFRDCTSFNSGLLQVSYSRRR